MKRPETEEKLQLLLNLLLVAGAWVLVVGANDK